MPTNHRILYRYFSELDILNNYKKDKEEHANHINSIRDIFIGNKIRFAKASNFNDPFDSISFIPSFDQLRRIKKQELENLNKTSENKLSDNEMENVLDTFFNDTSAADRIIDGFKSKVLDSFRILCLTEINNDILMWSHYSSGHKGFCIGFKISNDPSRFGPALEVSYPDNNEFPVIHLGTANMGVAIKIYLRKAKHWDYEKEWRMVCDENGSSIYDFPPDCLSAVIFGCKMPEEDIRIIMEWIRESKCSVNLYRAIKSKNKFEIKICPIKDSF